MLREMIDILKSVGFFGSDTVRKFNVKLMGIHNFSFGRKKG